MSTIKSFSLPRKREQNVKGCQNKETIMMTVKTFKLLCLKSATEKSSKIHRKNAREDGTLYRQESDSPGWNFGVL
jgi:hypothetical protein